MTKKSFGVGCLWLEQTVSNGCLWLKQALSSRHLWLKRALSDGHLWWRQTFGFGLAWFGRAVGVVCLWLGLWGNAQGDTNGSSKKTPQPQTGVVSKGLSPLEQKARNPQAQATSRPTSRSVRAIQAPRPSPIVVRVPPLFVGTRYFIRPVPRVILFSKGKKPKHAYNIALLAERLQKAPDSLVNKTVDIEGLVVRDLKALNCTLMLCLKGFPCCNRCSQPLMLRDAWGQQGFVFGGLYKGRYVGCAGTECSQICAPLVPNKRYRLRVTIKKLDIWSATKLSVYEMYHLHLVSFRPL